MILFLDFDGVLHPDPCMDAAQLFEHAPRLAALLEDFPEVGVVLSTSWRNVRPHEELMAGLPASLRDRVLGQTPRYGDIPRVHALPYRRQAECEHWLRLQGMLDSGWLALDDRADWFAPYNEHLIDCHSRRGFDEQAASRLESLLTLARLRAARGVDLELAI